MARHRRGQRAEALIESVHDAVVAAVASACRRRDMDVIFALLTPGVTVVVDGQGQVEGRRGACEQLMRAGVSSSVESVNGMAGLAYRRRGRIVGVASFSADSGVIDRIWLVLNPQKLQHWTHLHSGVDPHGH